jgi:hypothetical protein
MSDYVIGLANILGGVFFQALITGKISRTEANIEFWSDWRAQHPTFSKYGPPFLVAFGVIRIAIGLVGHLADSS